MLITLSAGLGTKAATIPAAIDALKEAVQLDLERGKAFEDLGYAYRHYGKFEDSVAPFQTPRVSNRMMRFR